MSSHIAPDGNVTPCHAATLGRCRICELTEVGGPHYREDYRRLYHPEDFGGEPLPETTMVVVASRPAAAPPIQAGLPMAGDLVAGLTAALGVDRAMKWIAKKTGRPCNCAARQAALNRADARARKLLARLTSRRGPR